MQPLYTHQGPACGNTTVSLPLNVGTVNIDGLTCPVSSGGAINMEVQVNLPSIVPSVRQAVVSPCVCADTAVRLGYCHCVSYP